jgi:hypothetical protein
MLRATCKNPDCGKTFLAERAGAQYCSLRCRVTAHRKRHAPPPATIWWSDEEEPRLATRSRTRNADGSRALSQAELAPLLVEIANTGDGGKPKTGRRFFYLALSHGHIQPIMDNTKEGTASRDAAYSRITEILGKLRKLNQLPWDAVLDLTRELDEWQTYVSPREARSRMRQVYDEDRWFGQLYYPVFIVEKDTMEPICRPMAMRWQMPFASSRGYSSLKLQHDVAAMLRQRHAKTGQWAIIYFISDHDPSGFDLQRAWEQAMADFNAHVHRFVRIGLTREQVTRLPEEDAILRQGIEVKTGDSRAKTYIRQYGNRCWETDILPAETIEQALDHYIHRWLDRKRWDRRAKEIEKARKLL